MSHDNIPVGMNESAGLEITDRGEPAKKSPSDVMRQQYRQLTPDEHNQITAIKGAGAEFFQLLNRLGSNRELSLAKTKIEEAVMWATKAITACVVLGLLMGCSQSVTYTERTPGMWVRSECHQSDKEYRLWHRQYHCREMGVSAGEATGAHR